MRSTNICVKCDAEWDDDLDYCPECYAPLGLEEYDDPEQTLFEAQVAHLGIFDEDQASLEAELQLEWPEEELKFLTGKA